MKSEFYQDRGDKMEDNYNGDMILIERLAECIYFEGWNEGQNIELEDISNAMQNGIPEQSEPYGDNMIYPVFPKSDDWHMGRVVYFINHPEEICNIKVDNVCNYGHILPFPLIEDGNHRLLAAKYLNAKGKMDKVHCLYGGRVDVLNYLVGITDVLPEY